MKKILSHRPLARVAMLAIAVSATGAVVALAGPYWPAPAPPRNGGYRNPPPHLQPPRFPKQQYRQKFQQPIQPNVRLPRAPRPPFGGGAAASPHRFSRLRQFPAESPVHRFLFGPARRTGFKPPLVAALDLDGDNLIDADELAKAVESLKAADANGDGNIGPEEWAPSFGGNTQNFLSNNRGRGKQPGRPTVGEGRPGPQIEVESNSTKKEKKGRKRSRKTKRDE